MPNEEHGVLPFLNILCHEFHLINRISHAFDICTVDNPLSLNYRDNGSI